MIKKIKAFHFILILSLLTVVSCEQLSEDTSPPIMSEETFRILFYDDNTEKYDSIITSIGGINTDPVEAPNEIILKGLFSDNVLLNRLEFKVTAQNPIEEDEGKMYSKSTTIEDFELPILGTSTNSFKSLDIPGSVISNTYDYVMVVYDEKENISKDYTWSLVVKNTNPLIVIDQIGTEYNTGDPITIEGEITSENNKFLKEASISFGDSLINIEVPGNTNRVEVNETITFLVSDASSEPQNLIISAKDDEDKTAILIQSLLIQ
ncbi:MAG: hypothetical protein KTR26_01705 [Flammeovirgaceae bacterium]|nr:hypothetical protein [Flammeovirgaceae bacterium]